ncbi:Ppx/GppA phosphatase family protein [Hyphomicrobium sp.]|uniref:Ppx/GppA phosphatase family protein n=1 Tax=Hyphomicrobium sp. TaxID=82 RepID=UPI0025C0C817|nr:Ppx/GppA phosphatase family protein [Hyphomicrobium sp.]
MKPANSDPDRSVGSGSPDNSNDDFSLVSGQEELPLPPNRFGNGGERRFRQRSPSRPGILSNRLTTSSRIERPAEWQRQSFDERNFSSGSNRPNEQIYGALDLGTNNCRLLLARPSRRGFQVVDAFSRIIRLGEGVSQTGRLSDLAMNRTLDALRVCAGKLHRHHVSRTRLVATQACRVAANGSSFVDKVKNIFDLDIEILTPKTEAHLAVAGCATLIDPTADYVLVFDIGGGSSEIVWLDLTRLGSRRDVWTGRSDVNDAIVAWESLPVGVVTLAEHFGGREVTQATFAAMSKAVTELLLPFEAKHRFRELMAGKPVHFLGTSGTVTTIAGVMLGLERYDRKRVDGIWLNVGDIDDVTSKLLGQSYEERISEPCIGRERADLVLAGCAILDAILKLWPADRLRVADRGLREGILMQLMMEDGVWRAGRRRRGRSKRSNGAEQS